MKRISEWFSRNYVNLIIFSYIIPILFAAGVSIAHVITWYKISNPMSWAIYLSVGIEIAALSSLAGIAVRLNKAVYVPFFIVTFIQLIGNVFFCYQYIDITDPLFLSWVELTNPAVDYFGLIDDLSDLISHKRLLAFLSGGLIPVISLTFLHLLVSFIDANNDEKEKSSPTIVKDNEVTEEEVVEPVVKKTPVIIEEELGVVLEEPDEEVVIEEPEEEFVEDEPEVIENIEKPVIIDPDDDGGGPPDDEVVEEPKIFDEIDKMFTDEPITYIENEKEEDIDVFDHIDEVIVDDIKQELDDILNEEDIVDDEVKQDLQSILNRDIRTKQNIINKLKKKFLKKIRNKKNKPSEKKESETNNNIEKKRFYVSDGEKKYYRLVYRNKRKEFDSNDEDKQ